MRSELWPGGAPLRGARSTPAPATTDFVEDFSAFADGDVPSEPRDRYDYGTSDGLNDVTVRVAATSGGLTDRPLVLGTAGSVLAGSSNFSIARPAVAPVIEADRGVIRLSMDVQVNSGGFCAFFTVRNAASAPVSVILHNLSYTMGGPFEMVMIMDVDAGTISATQDGVPVAISRTHFPYLPTRFAVESCTLGAQESALDNVRIEHRTPWAERGAGGPGSAGPRPRPPRRNYTRRTYTSERLHADASESAYSFHSDPSCALIHSREQPGCAR